ncbi:MAG: glutathione S-transferase [Pseudomonadota bacterium]
MTDLPSPIMLHDTPRAPNPRRVRIFMAEKGISLPVTPVDIMTGEQFAAHKDRVGSHNVPALALEDGSFLTETVAICRYLEALHPEPNLMGRDPLETARIEMWSRRVEFQLMFPVASVLRHGNPAMAVMEEQCPAWAEANGPRVARGLVWLNASLEGKDYLAGDRFTVADITALVTVDFMRTIRTPVPEEHGATHRWLERVRARDTLVP